GKDYAHRKVWLENRMLSLCDIFSVEIYAYAVMDNHYHIVLYLDPKRPLNWSDEEIAERWLSAYPGRLDEPRFAKQRELKKQDIVGDKKKLKSYRKRLGSLSWFMGRLNEPLAKRSNQEDFCTGSFWQGRYSAQALLDEGAVFSCMTYVDLNPVRAKIADKLETSMNTAIKSRLDTIQALGAEDRSSHLKESITSINHPRKSKPLSMTVREYIDLVEWTGRSIIYPNKAALPNKISASLGQLNLQQNHWLKQIEQFNNNYCHVVGPIEQIRLKALQIKRRCLKGISAATLLYQPSD
ncbi:MAG: hypothetical protein L3J46_07050, partial [Kangiellaceae bacterium]|nr:hypothetical protein [Kangiellaceae bacterium]